MWRGFLARTLGNGILLTARFSHLSSDGSVSLILTTNKPIRIDIDVARLNSRDAERRGIVELRISPAEPLY
jgi:hypothetical protein